MCRFVAYLGPPISLASLLTEPRNSLIRQSTHAAERAEPLNGDGFGLAWYDRDVGIEPGIFRSTTPAWANENLRDLARMVSSRCLFAHVRAASQASSVAELNCHPFRWGRYAFMHNGDVGGFPRVRRTLVSELSDESFAAIRGSTDSEHVFALFLDALSEREARQQPDDLARAIERTVGRILELTRRHAAGESSDLNLAVTDGESIVACRYTDDPEEEGESLYVHVGQRYECVDGICRMVDPETRGGAVIVSSERLSDDDGWRPIPRNHLCLIGGDGTARLEPLEG
ncbi:MAG TPA: class II glutamine amidotransferase [Thermoanaerobaculia bacterium]|nr:class II glutamine amidotransferase [Thermoanaerobaculia bacterium]